MDTRQTVLLTLAGIGLLKSLSGLFKPQWLRLICEKWIPFATKAGKAIAGVCILFGGGLWALVLYHEDLTNWALLLFGALLGWAASVYARPEKLKSIAEHFITKRSDHFIRAISCIGLVAMSALIWIAIRGL